MKVKEFNEMLERVNAMSITTCRANILYAKNETDVLSEEQVKTYVKALNKRIRDLKRGAEECK